MAFLSSTLCLVFVVICLSSFSHSAQAHPANELDISKKDASYDSALTLISVEREPTQDGNRFTVRYTKNVDDLIFRIQDNLGAPREPTEVEEGNGVWAASFVMPVSSKSQYFLIGDADFQHMVAMDLENHDSTPLQQNIVELPVIHVTPASEAVYEPDEDVVITASVQRNSQTGEVVSNFRKMLTAVDLNTMELHQDLEDDDLFTLGMPQELDDRIQASMTIHTSTRPVSGHLQLSTSVHSTGGALVSFIQVSRSIVVKPSGQAGPYPDGYLALVRVYFAGSSNGNERHRCRVGQECLFYCASAGSSISGMEVKEVQADGSLADVPSAEMGLDILDTARAIYWKFQSEEDSGNSDGITTFQCKATDVTHGKVVTNLVEVLAEIDGSIDESRSIVTVENHPMHTYLKTVTLTCVVKGRPLPEVYFQGGSTYQFYNSDVPDTVVPTGQNEATATRVVTVDSSELTQAIQRISEGRDTSPSCNIYSETEGSFISHDFYPTLCK